MKTTIIQLEEHDDVITVQDRLAWAKSARVVLIWPEEGRILTRLLDLVLVQRAGRQQGQQVGLVTHDPQVVEHARELGIPVFRNQKRALRSVWRRKPQRGRLLRPRRNIAPPAEELRKIRPVRSHRPLSGGIRFIFFSLGLLAIIALILFLIPAATVYLPLERTDQEVEFSVWLSPEINSPTLAGKVPVNEDRVVIEEEGEIPSSGRISLPDQTASGHVIFTNLTVDAVVIGEGTVVLTLDTEPKRYITTQAARLAGGSGETIQVKVQAEAPGKIGNTISGSIRAVEGSIGLQVSVDNPEPIAGGTERTEVGPSAMDEQKLRQQLYTKMEKKAAEWLRGNYVEGAYTVQASIRQVMVIEEERIPAEGQPGASLRLRLKVEYQGWVVMGDNLRSAARNVLNSRLPDGMAVVEDTIWLMFGEISPTENDEFLWRLTAKRQIAPTVEADQIIQLMLGKPREKILKELTEKFSLRSEPTILISPKWWPWLPAIESQIRVEVQ
jgi:hypothetical protein